MLIEAAKGGHTNVVQILLDYPHSIMMSSVHNNSMSLLLSQNPEIQTADAGCSKTYSNHISSNIVESKKSNIVSQKYYNTKSTTKKQKGDCLVSVVLEQSDRVSSDSEYPDNENCKSCSNNPPSKRISECKPSEVLSHRDFSKFTKEEAIIHKTQLLAELQVLSLTLLIKIKIL